MEFMTSGSSQRVTPLEYGLFVNIYSGQVGAKMEIVVGEDNDEKQWISKPIIREKMELNSRKIMFGLVRDNAFVVYQGRLGSQRYSSGAMDSPYLTRGFAKFWTVNDLLEAAGIEFDTERVLDTVYEHELKYDRFSYDKLENLLLPA